MSDKKVVSISFKSTTKDTKLYTLLMSMEDRSAVVKDILYKVFIEGKKVE